MKKGDTIRLRLDSAAFEGKAIGRHEDIPVFVKYAAPGDLALVTVTQKKKDFAEARLVEVLERGPDRISPVCKHFEECGGCQWQHVDYKAQAAFKHRQVRDLLHRIGGLRSLEPEPTLENDRPFGYRNKMEYTFSDSVWIPRNSANTFIPERPAGGLHVPGRFDKILDLHQCELPGSLSWQILDHVRTYARKHGLEGYDTVHHRGFLRNLIVRNTEKTGDWLVALVTSRNDATHIPAIAGSLRQAFPQVATFVHFVNPTKSPMHNGFPANIHFGKGFIEDEVGSFTYRIHPLAFFQTNVRQANRLFETAIQYADIQQGETVFDLYCGVGTLTFMSARNAGAVLGIELSPEAIENARFNAKFNGIDHCTFVEGDMQKVFVENILKAHGKPDVIITDPPRAGMHPEVIETLLAIGATKMVYVSCNPATMARDLKLLSSRYSIDRVQPVDMFPQTYHIECVARLTLLPAL